MEMPYNLFRDMSEDRLAEEIRTLACWDADYLVALAYRLGVDCDDDNDCQDIADRIFSETGIDLNSNELSATGEEPEDLYMNMSIVQLAEEIRTLPDLSARYLEALAYRLGVDRKDDDDCCDLAGRILSETGIDLLSDEPIEIQLDNFSDTDPLLEKIVSSCSEEKI